MAILIYAESENGKYKKDSFEIASYAKVVADKLNTSVTAISINADNPNELGDYGVSKVLNISSDNLKDFNAFLYADVIKQAFEKEDSSIVIISSSSNTKYLGSILSVKINAGYVTNVVDVPKEFNPITVKRNSFTNKAFEYAKVNSKNSLLAISKNSHGIIENKTTAQIENFEVSIESSDTSVKSTEKATNKVTIADAEIVISGGRGLKGPENWGMIEELADILGAATACSKPVSDLGWRPHSEHVGQTGKLVSSNLYIAIGISGAIQHLAGINSSKVKVVINTDPEAPFFKSADYGIVGDAFEVVPKLIEGLKTFKSQNA
ncbi:MAG: electron transfer flavoprotein subunit alpha/FixB family protein [Flavobacteriaceae bacterium]|nr:electron transfer flavoprotein subunit alpha/FixB family protein [Flavobacteriaceae bacterium]